MSDTRTERDSMGPMEVPADAYYGASTQRAVLNFPISTLRFSRPFIRVLGLIKGTAARVNAELGLLDAKTAEAIEKAAREVADGKFDAEFVIDIFQTGSGTSTNMNANEVIANRASELLGGDRGSKLVHPNDHVNKGQSSNDVIPTAIHIAALVEIEQQLIPALADLEDHLRAKSKEFWDVIKTGRTHLQDATPMRLGQEFLGYAGRWSAASSGLAARRRSCPRWRSAARPSAPASTRTRSSPRVSAPCYRRSWASPSARRTTTSRRRTRSMACSRPAASCERSPSASTRSPTTSAGSAPGRAPGIGEIALPEVQPGSSIMPGKVNPVIAESLLQVVAQVIGNDAAVLQAAHGGVFELNMMMPVAGHNLLESIELLAAASRNFAEQCVAGLKATDRGPAMVERGLMLGTALVPAVGYDKSAEIAKKAAKTGQTIREVAREETQLSEAELDELLNPVKMTEPGLGGGLAGG